MDNPFDIIERKLTNITALLLTILERMDEKKQQESLISPEETCKIFNPAISKTTLNKWEKMGYLKMYRIGGRTYFKHSEVIESAKQIKRNRR